MCVITQKNKHPGIVHCTKSDIILSQPSSQFQRSKRMRLVDEVLEQFPSELSSIPTGTTQLIPSDYLSLAQSTPLLSLTPFPLGKLSFHSDQFNEHNAKDVSKSHEFIFVISIIYFSFFQMIISIIKTNLPTVYQTYINTNTFSNTDRCQIAKAIVRHLQDTHNCQP